MYNLKNKRPFTIDKDDSLDSAITRGRFSIGYARNEVMNFLNTQEHSKVDELFYIDTKTVSVKNGNIVNYKGSIYAVKGIYVIKGLMNLCCHAALVSTVLHIENKNNKAYVGYNEVVRMSPGSAPKDATDLVRSSKKEEECDLGDLF